jgi:hypothetical protein
MRLLQWGETSFRVTVPVTHLCQVHLNSSLSPVLKSGYFIRETQPPIRWEQRALSLGVKWPGREADSSPLSSAEVKECVELYLYFPIRLHGVVLS